MCLISTALLCNDTTHRNNNTSNSLNVKSNVNDSCQNGLNRLSTNQLSVSDELFPVWQGPTNRVCFEFFAVARCAINRRGDVTVEWCRGLGEFFFFVSVLHKRLTVVRLGQFACTYDLTTRSISHVILPN